MPLISFHERERPPIGFAKEKEESSQPIEANRDHNKQNGARALNMQNSKTDAAAQKGKERTTQAVYAKSQNIARENAGTEGRRRRRAYSGSIGG